MFSDPDPHSNRFDLSADTVEYAKTRAQLVKELIPGLVERTTKDGEDYTQARRAFNILLSQYGQSMFFASRYVGGMHTSRSHKGDENARLPLEFVDVKKQREALKLIETHVLNDKPFNFPPELYNQLGPTRWRHWGTRTTRRKDFPVHDVISMWQEQVLYQLFSTSTLERIHDTELKIPASQDAFTVAELIERLTKAIFSEVDTVKKGSFTNRKPAISSLRRNLQRIYLRRLASLALGHSYVPDDCQTIAFAELGALSSRIAKLLESKVTLDSYSRAHLQETKSRIDKVLDARLTLSQP